MRSTSLLLGFVLFFSFACPATMAASKNNFMPGADNSLSWQRLDFNKSLEAGKPILLYVYDPMKGNNLAEELEKEVLPNEAVKTAFADFLAVKIPTCDRNWPPAIAQLGTRGAALILMTCDGKSVSVFTRGNMPRFVKDASRTKTYPDLVTAAQAAKQQNVKAQELVKKNPPPKFTPPGTETAAAAAPEPEEKPKGMQGLLGGEEGKQEPGKKADVANAADKAKEEAARKAEQEKKRVSDENE
jgi:hypothetical protein